MSARHLRMSRQPRRESTAFTWHGYAPLDAALSAQLRAASGDVAEGARRWRSWTYLAVEQMKNQYRRTVIGPWWLTLQTAAYVVGLAILFGAIFHQPLDEFVPYVGAGFIGYSLLAGLTRQAADVFVTQASTLTSTRQPLSVLVFRAVTVELLQFGHNLLIVAVLIATGLAPLSPALLLVIPGIAVIVLNGVAVGLWLGPTAARYRDVGPFITSILQVMIFFTPVFWQVDEIHPDSRTVLVGWNPFAYLLAVFRDPLLGEVPSSEVWAGVAAITAVNLALAFWVFARTRSQLPYWVS